MKALFVGGHHNGQEHTVPNYPIIRLPYIDPHTGNLRIETYHRQTLATSKMELIFFTAQDLTIEDAVMRVFENYKV